MARKARIAVSVFFGMLAVALCVLWVRSYWRMDQVTKFDADFTMLYSNRGWLTWNQQSPNQLLYAAPPTSWRHDVVPADEQVQSTFWKKDLLGTSAAAPHLLLALAAAGCAGLPWLRVRFGMRGLLIATTLVAAVLGVAVWAVR